ncbi:MAG: hypothetical protein IKY18_06755 [Oscillospiraceae bacterium]|nr:hypothetical protein [Oscillospiraceae bacterium]
MQVLFIIAGILFYGSILTAIGIFAYHKIKPLPPEKKKKIYIWSGVVLAVIVIAVAIIGVVSYLQNRILPTEEYLLGEWTASNENGEATIVFEKDNGEYTAEWSIYDYSNKEWSKSTFTIKEIDNYVMTILMDDGTIEFVPFAVSKDTLFFADTEYKSENKNVPIPKEKFAYIVDDVIHPVTMGCYMGMSVDEADKALPYKLEERYSNSYYCELPEEKYGEVSLQLRFDDEYGLDEIKYWIDDKYYEDRYTLIEYLSDLYGEYEEKQWSNMEKYYSYIWTSGNLEIRLTEDTEEKSIFIDYSIDTDWLLEYKRNNKD